MNKDNNNEIWNNKNKNHDRDKTDNDHNIEYNKDWIPRAVAPAAAL